MKAFKRRSVFNVMNAMYTTGTKIRIDKASQGQLVLLKLPYSGQVATAVVSDFDMDGTSRSRRTVIRCSDSADDFYSVDASTRVVALMTCPQLSYVELPDDADAVETSAVTVDTKPQAAVKRLPQRLYGVLRQHLRGMRSSVTANERDVLQSLDLGLTITGMLFGSKDVARCWSIDVQHDTDKQQRVHTLLAAHNELKASIKTSPINSYKFSDVMGRHYQHAIRVLGQLLTSGMRVNNQIAAKLKSLNFGLELADETEIEREEGLRYVRQLSAVAERHVLTYLCREFDINRYVISTDDSINSSWLLRILASGATIDLTAKEADLIQLYLNLPTSVPHQGFKLPAGPLKLVNYALTKAQLKPIDLAAVPLATQVQIEILARTGVVSRQNSGLSNALISLGLDIEAKEDKTDRKFFNIHADVKQARRLAKMLNPNFVFRAVQKQIVKNKQIAKRAKMSDDTSW